MRSLSAIFLIVSALSSGCTGLRSIEHHADGVVYHLPKTLLEITVRQYTALTDAGAVQRVWYSLGGPDELKKADRSRIQMSADENYNFAVHSEIRSLSVPDAEQRYVMKYRPSAFSDDRLCISRRSDGLLHDVQFVTDDRTPEVVFNIARFLSAFVGSAPEPPKKPAAFDATVTDGTAKPKIIMRSYTNKLDPFNRQEVRAFNNGLREVLGARVNLDVSNLRRTVAQAMGLPEDACDSTSCPPVDLAKRCSSEHICYRTKLRLPVDLKHDGRRVDMKYADVINAWDVGAISVTRAFMVQKITKLRFEEGALVAAVIRKPSEVEEASLLPVNVMTAILSIPTGLLQSAFADYNTKIDVIKKLNENKLEIAKFKDNYKALLTEGAAPIGVVDASNAVQERYELNCSDGARSGFINVLNPTVSGQTQDFQ